MKKEFEMVNGKKIPMRTWMIPFTSKELSATSLLATNAAILQVSNVIGVELGDTLKIEGELLKDTISQFKSFMDKVTKAFEEYEKK